MWLLILTGQRRDEIGQLSWIEIVENGDGSRIELPGGRGKDGRTKNHLPHVVPLSPQAMACLPDRCNITDMVFGRLGRSGRGYSGWSKAKRQLDEAIAAARKRRGVREPMKPWRLHDLRHTFVTLMREKRFADKDLVELIVNHVSGSRAGVAGLYDKSERLAERREALARWGEWIAATPSSRDGRCYSLRWTFRFVLSAPTGDGRSDPITSVSA